jgi:hypothetical protein
MHKVVTRSNTLGCTTRPVCKQAHSFHCLASAYVCRRPDPSTEDITAYLAQLEECVQEEEYIDSSKK